MKIAIAQLDLLVGGIEANTNKIIENIKIAKASLKADLVVFPELAITGYPPEDLLFNHACKAKVEHALEKISQASQGIDILIGYPRYNGHKIYNSAAFIQNGKISAIYDKQRLPNNAVFDEKRYFECGDKPVVVNCNGINIGILICEDIWASGPASFAKEAGAQILVSIHASPYEAGKVERRIKIASDRVKETGLALIYAPCVGGQDELLFDGGGFALSSKSQLTQSLPQFCETLSLVQLETHNGKLEPKQTELLPNLTGCEEIYQALVSATRAYIEKNHFPGVLLGLSGGIDSALTLAIAVDALGPDRVEAILMPSRYTADISNADAINQVQTLEVKHQIIPIEPIFNSFLVALSDSFAGKSMDLTEENLQARCRGSLLMALSNKSGKLVLTTSNKSESAVGYSTLYGDMAGGFNILKDVYKTQVYELARYRNLLSPVIPERVITRAPSAELRHNQTDQDSLPDYSILDSILKSYIENNLSGSEITSLTGIELKVVQKVISLIKRSEYKRRQAPIGPKISVRALGKDWRMPITSGF